MKFAFKLFIGPLTESFRGKSEISCAASGTVKSKLKKHYRSSAVVLQRQKVIGRLRNFLRVLQVGA